MTAKSTGTSTPMTIAALAPQHLDALRALHMQVFGDTMGVSLGKAYQRRFLRFFLDVRGGTMLGAFDGVDASAPLIGYVFGLPATELKQLNRAVLPTAMFAIATQPKLWLRHDVRHEMGRRARSLLGLTQPHVGATDAAADQPTQVTSSASQATIPEERILELVGIGSSATARGRGIGEALIRAFAAAAKARGNQLVRLTVYDHNDGARRLYARCGFVERGYVPGAKTIICELTV